MANYNIGRLSEDIKRELSTALRDIKDSRIRDWLVSISNVDLTSDLSYCKVYVVCLEGGEKTEAAVEILKKASGFFKKKINARIKMRKIPELIFVPDNSLDYYEHIDNVLKGLPKAKTDDSEEI